jgi:hypothetical protein
VRRGWLLAWLVCWLAGWLPVTAACRHGDPPPEVPSCAAAADHVRSLLGPEASHASRIRDAFAARCEADGWDDEVRACVVATTSLRKPRHCKAMLTRDQRAALDRELAAVAATPAVGRLPAACRDCGAMIERLAGCAVVPRATRGELQLAYHELTQAWMRGNYDARAVEVQCRSLSDRVRQAFAAKCGW